MGGQGDNVEQICKARFKKYYSKLVWVDSGNSSLLLQIGKQKLASKAPLE